MPHGPSTRCVELLAGSGRAARRNFVGLGMTTMSSPPGDSRRLNTLPNPPLRHRFRSTAPPTFLLAAMPTRVRLARHLANAHAHELAVPLDALLEHPGELAPAAQPRRAWELSATGSSGAIRLRRRPSAACGPWPGGASAPAGRSWFPCGRGSRVSWRGGGYWVGTCASLWPLSVSSLKPRSVASARARPVNAPSRCGRPVKNSGFS